MSRLKQPTTNYYTLQGGVGYKAFLDHFKHQAEGQRQSDIRLVSNTVGQIQTNKGLRLRLVKLTSENAVNDIPKLEVIDPNEAVKNRAASELKREISDNAPPSANIAQSAVRRRRRKNISTTQAASKAVKRARDVFDP